MVKQTESLLVTRPSVEAYDLIIINIKTTKPTIKKCKIKDLVN